MVVKIMDLIGKSSTSWPGAVEEAISKAGKSVRNIYEVDVVSLKAQVKDGKIAEFLAHVRLAFEIE
ncbi:dodecin domain-containing protein [Candidatus Pacearchaeota archaeon]|nr:dodecin domain-containing protein [Candidatus Pacearchaeota archaeon]